VSQQLGALQKLTTDTFLFISHTTNVLLLKFRCDIFIGVRIVKELPGSVASGTPCIIIIAPPLQQWLHQRASILRRMYVAFLVIILWVSSHVRRCFIYCNFTCVLMIVCFDPKMVGIQGVSRLVDIIAGGDFLGLCDQKSSYKHVSDSGRLRSYGHFLIPLHALV